MIKCLHCGSIPEFAGIQRFGIIALGLFRWCNMKCYINFKGFNS